MGAARPGACGSPAAARDLLGQVPCVCQNNQGIIDLSPRNLPIMGVVNQRMLVKANQQQILRYFPNESLAIERLQTTSGWTMCPGKKEVPEEAAL